jgi:predicted amidophosphoribosyltransferase
MDPTKFRKFFTFLLDLLIPRGENLKRLEAMTPAEFRELATQGVSALSEKSPTDAIILFDYKNSLVRQAIWELKYRGNRKIVKLLAECLYEYLVEELTERKTFENFKSPILIPVPLSKKREHERGFNQCELLARALEKHDLGKNFFEVRTDILIKTKDTESQTRKKSNRTA